MSNNTKEESRLMKLENKVSSLMTSLEKKEEELKKTIEKISNEIYILNTIFDTSNRSRNLIIKYFGDVADWLGKIEINKKPHLVNEVQDIHNRVEHLEKMIYVGKDERKKYIAPPLQSCRNGRDTQG